MLKQQHVGTRSLRSRLLSTFLRYTVKPILTSKYYNPVRSRSRLERTMGKRKPAEGVSITEIDTGSVKGEWHTPEESRSNACIFYLHGGGYLVGSPRVYRSVTTRLAQLSGARVFSLDYRLAPEHPFPAAIDDALSAYQWLMAEGIDPATIVLAGDSAGGGLSLALIHTLKNRQLPLPAAACVFSPYADLLVTGESLKENSKSCAMFDGPAVARAASFYLQGQHGSSPLASPLYGDFSGFPPLSIYVSDSEAVRDDGIRLAEKADKAGVAVQLSIWKQQPHAWPAFYPLLPEADHCLQELAQTARLVSKPGE